MERPDLDFPRLNDVLGVMSEAAHIFVPIGQMRPISTHIRTDWTLLYVSCITNKSYHYSPSPFSNNGTLAQNITRNLSLLLGREIKYRHLGHAPEDNHGQHSDDSGVYLCILMKHLLAERLEVEVDKDPSNYVVDTVTGRKRLLDAIEAYKAYTNGAEMIRL